MTPLAATFLILVCGWLISRWAGTRRGTVEINPRYRELLQKHRLTDAADFLDLEGVIVSGHPGRNVTRVTLRDGARSVILYLKREERVSLAARVGNVLAGFGFVSLSRREATVLRALPHAGIDAPDWVADGMDGRGRAFLLLREVTDAVELRTFLAGERDPRWRANLLRGVARAIAKLHDAGFHHSDLYAKHVLLDREGGTVVLLDWQRSRQRAEVPLALRARDLAALNVTIPPELAPRYERLAFLRAYVEFWQWSRAETRQLIGAVLAESARLLTHRHVREKGQPAVPGQQWVPFDGGDICVSPAFQRIFPVRPAWLSFDQAPAAANGEPARGDVPLGGGRRATLIRRRTYSITAALTDLVRRRAAHAPEQDQAALLMRLERYGVPGPRVLAMGCRRSGLGRVDSLLLTETAVEGESLAAWVRNEHDEASRRRLLARVGAMVKRLHEACCHLPDYEFPLAICRGKGGMVPVLTEAEGLLVTRVPSPSLVARNLAALERELRDSGASAADMLCLLEGYTANAGPLPAPVVEEAETAGNPRAAFGQNADGADTAVAVLQGKTLTGLVARPLAASQTESRPSLWRRIFGGGRRLSQRTDWAEFAGADWADRIMGLEIADRFHAKQGRSTCRWTLAVPDGAGGEKRLAVYLKRHYRLPWWRGLLAALWPGGNWSPAFSEFQHLEWARAQGVPVPAVAAAAEFNGSCGRLQSVLAVEELTDMLPLHEAVPLAAARLDPDAFRQWKRGLVAEMARITRILHDRRRFHKDLYLCHFYIARDDTARVPEWQGRVFLIDLHRLMHHAWTWRLWQTKDLAQLLYSSDVPGIDARDRLQFWRDYLGPERGRGWSWVRLYVLFKWRRYRRHNARRKAAAPSNAA